MKIVVRVLVAGLSWAAMTSAPAGVAARPNVLLIMTDQQFADAMSCRMG